MAFGVCDRGTIIHENLEKENTYHFVYPYTELHPSKYDLDESQRNLFLWVISDCSNDLITRQIELTFRMDKHIT